MVYPIDVRSANTNDRVFNSIQVRDRGRVSGRKAGREGRRKERRGIEGGRVGGGKEEEGGLDG